tara:strand:+ start:115 stop:387 length:273 start_codon:yes stop_codon:yes gene_type:complete
MNNTTPQVYNKSTLLKEYYTRTYKSDELGEELNNNVTFVDLFECLDNYQDVYDLIGVYDSLLRERLFEKLAQMMCVDYDYIYNQWMECSN